MDQIAVETGVSKRTIYEIFKGKDDLLKICIEQMDLQNKSEMNAIIAGTDNVIEALYKIGQHGERKKSAINHLFFDDLEKHYPQFRSIFTRRGDSATGSIIYTILKKGIHEGIFIEDINIAIVDVFIHEMMVICHKNDLFPDEPESIEILKNIVIPYFKGICKPKGIDLIEKYFSM